MGMSWTVLGLFVLYTSFSDPVDAFLVGTRNASRKSFLPPTNRDVSELRREASGMTFGDRLLTKRGRGHGRGRGDKAGCRGTMMLMDPDMTIESPRYPRDYKDNLNCRWLIEAPQGYVIQMTFDSPVSIEGTAGSCSYDSLSIYDGSNREAAELANLCGEQQPLDVTSTGNTAFLQFRTDSTVHKRGFSLTYTFVAVAPTSDPDRGARCSGITETTESTGAVSSPGFPTDNYGDYSNCGFRILATPGHIIQLQFTDFDLEYEPSCLYDSVSVYDGPSTDSPLLAMHCGSSIPSQISSSGASLLVMFVSDYSYTQSGFRFEWTLLSVGGGVSKESPACGANKPQILDREEGEFSSHGYNDGVKYTDNLDCAWRVVVPMSMRAHLHFMDFSLEDSNLCRYDHLAIYDGYDATGDAIGPYCGDTTPGDITATGNVLYVVLKTDSSVTAKGFKARFSGKEKITSGSGGGGNENAMCGVPSIEPKFGRIVGGQTAVPYSWPWQVSMQNKNHPFSGAWGHWCGGAVIHPEWVITAAHCVTDDPDHNLYRVVIGDHNRELSTDRSEITVHLNRLIMHDLYNADTYDYDIALFHLASPITYRSEISPICLPDVDIPERTLCVTTGWGETKGTADNTYLQQVQVPVLPRAECNQADWYGSQITPNMMCAGYPEGRKDSCQGDSGGPLVCSSGGPWRLYGLTSWGRGCAEPKKPGVYTRVARFKDWIEENTGLQF